MNYEDGGVDVLSILPHLAERVADFEQALLQEPCTHPANEGMDEKINGCMIISNPRMMCPPCRLRLRFFHCVYNAEAYKPELGDEDATG
jgi:hypothetical protein